MRRHISGNRLCERITAVVFQSGGVYGKAHGRVYACKRVRPIRHNALCRAAEVGDTEVVAENSVLTDTHKPLGRGVGVQRRFVCRRRVIRPTPHIRSSRIVEIVDTVVETADNIFCNVIEHLVRDNFRKSVLHGIRKRYHTALSRSVVIGDTVVETAHNILGVVAECCSVDCTKGRGGKPVLEVGSPRNEARLAGCGVGVQRVLEPVHQCFRRIGEVRGLGLDTVHKSRHELLTDLFHVHEHTRGQLNITVAERFHFGKEALILLEQVDCRFQFGYSQVQLFVEGSGLVENVLYIVCQFLNRVLRKPTDDGVNGCAQSGNSRNLCVPNDLTCEIRHKVYELAHVGGKGRELVIESVERGSEVVTKLIGYRYQTLRKYDERRRQFDKQSRTETDSQREQTRTCNRSRAKSGSHYADTDKQSRTETDSRCNGFPVVKNRLPCLPDFVQALTDSPNLHEKQPRCDTQLCENCSTESNVHDERCTDRTKQSSHNTDNR